VVESKRGRNLGNRKHPDALGVIPRFGNAVRFGDVHDRRGVRARVARWIRIDAEHRLQLNLECGFLLCLPRRGMLHALADIHESARYRPAIWRMPTLDQHDGPPRAIRELNDDVRRKRGRFRRRHDSFPYLWEFAGIVLVEAGYPEDSVRPAKQTVRKGPNYLSSDGGFLSLP